MMGEIYYKRVLRIRQAKRIPRSEGYFYFYFIEELLKGSVPCCSVLSWNKVSILISAVVAH